MWVKFVHQLRTEEFKSLRAEIEMLVKDARSLELYVLTGLVAYYAWLLTHCVPGATTLVPLTHAKLSLQLVPWLIPIALPILGAWRSWANLGRIIDIGAYITEIEGNLFADDRPLGPRKGWEHFVEKRRRERPIRQASHTIVWILLIGVTVVMALFGSELGVAACKPSVPV
jgi:hypothetical protein